MKKIKKQPYITKYYYYNCRLKEKAFMFTNISLHVNVIYV